MKIKLERGSNEPLTPEQIKIELDILATLADLFYRHKDSIVLDSVFIMDCRVYPDNISLNMSYDYRGEIST
jgi:hypothetical protein